MASPKKQDRERQRFAERAEDEPLSKVRKMQAQRERESQLARERILVERRSKYSAWQDLGFPTEADLDK